VALRAFFGKIPKQELIFHISFSYYLDSSFFNFFSIVTQDEVSILLILPQRLRSDLKVSSSIISASNISLSQLSVSTHSLRAILNFESISARLCGYCASAMFAKTLEGANMENQFLFRHFSKKCSERRLTSSIDRRSTCSRFMFNVKYPRSNGSIL